MPLTLTLFMTLALALTLAHVHVPLTLYRMYLRKFQTAAWGQLFRQS